MRATPIFSVALCATLFLGACKGPSGSFPSLAPRAGENPRVIEAPGGDAPIRLSDAERQSLSADVARESKQIAQVESELRTEGATLSRALTSARGAKIGTESWSNAQMALSRYDLARAPLGEIEARLTPMLRTVDSLSPDDPDRQSVEALASATARLSADSKRRADEAGAQLNL